MDLDGQTETSNIDGVIFTSQPPLPVTAALGVQLERKEPRKAVGQNHTACRNLRVHPSPFPSEPAEVAPPPALCTQLPCALTRPSSRT